MDFFLFFILLMVFILLIILYYWQQIVNILAEKMEIHDNVQTIKKQMESDLDDSNTPLVSPSPISVSDKPSKMYSFLNKTTENIAWFLEQPELFFKNIQIKSFEIMEKTLGLSSQNI